MEKKERNNKNIAQYIINNKTQPRKNSTLCKTHKEGNSIWPLETGCNAAIKNLSRSIEINCVSLTNNIETRINDTEHLLQTIDNINELPNYTILVSYEIFNMFPNIDTIKGIEAIKLALQSRPSQKPFADCILQGLEVCLYNNNSKFD